VPAEPHQLSLGPVHRSLEVHTGSVLCGRARVNPRFLASTAGPGWPDDDLAQAARPNRIGGARHVGSHNQ
jgi:hypothetical protein